MPKSFLEPNCSLSTTSSHFYFIILVIWIIIIVVIWVLWHCSKFINVLKDVCQLGNILIIWKFKPHLWNLVCVWSCVTLTLFDDFIYCFRMLEPVSTGFVPSADDVLSRKCSSRYLTHSLHFSFESGICVRLRFL